MSQHSRWDYTDWYAVKADQHVDQQAAIMLGFLHNGGVFLPERQAPGCVFLQHGLGTPCRGGP